ncbi:hypothetical protein AC1031_020899 [Aphanomyces cochlioides]|nr:hypothetical protein AC1031_020899 [Aphanomyces cochlioides]
MEFFVSEDYLAQAVKLGITDEPSGEHNYIPGSVINVVTPHRLMWGVSCVGRWKYVWPTSNSIGQNVSSGDDDQTTNEVTTIDDDDDLVHDIMFQGKVVQSILRLLIFQTKSCGGNPRDILAPRLTSQGSSEGATSPAQSSGTNEDANHEEETKEEPINQDEEETKEEPINQDEEETKEEPINQDEEETKEETNHQDVDSTVRPPRQKKRRTSAERVAKMVRMLS